METRADLLTARFGLIMSPTGEQCERWVRRVADVAAAGSPVETAADIAAQMVFPGYGLAPLDHRISIARILPTLQPLDNQGGLRVPPQVGSSASR